MKSNRKAKILIAVKSFEKIPIYFDTESHLMSSLKEQNRSTKGQDPLILEKKLHFFESFPKVTQFGSSKCFQKNKNSSKISSIALPQTQTKYTVLRSPHIDKKSRDQFELTIHKHLIRIKTSIKDLRKRLYQLKFHQMQGIQMKIVFQTKTRFPSLDLF